MNNKRATNQSTLDLFMVLRQAAIFLTETNSETSTDIFVHGLKPDIQQMQSDRFR